MKKKSLIISSFIMCLVLVVALASVSVAWFGEISSTSNVLIISSERPSGAATILVEEATNSGVKLKPATLKNGIALVGDINKIDVLDKGNLIVADPDNSPISAKATTVTITFPYMYVGAPDQGATTKQCEISLLSVTLLSPTSVDEDGNIINPDQMNFIDEFACKMVTADVDGEISSTAKLFLVQLIPGNTYNCQITLNFAFVDELCDPMLLDTGIFFNFQIKTLI